MIEHDTNNGGAKELLRTLGQDIREATREVGLWSSLLAMAVSMLIAYWTLVGRLSAHSKRGHFARQSTESYSAQDPLQPLGDRSVPNDQIQGILHDRHMYSTSMVEAADVPLYFQTLARAGPEGHHRMPKAWYGAATFGISASDPNGDLQSVPENARMNELLRNDLAALVPPPTTILPWQLESRDGSTTDGFMVQFLLADIELFQVSPRDDNSTSKTPRPRNPAPPSFGLVHNLGKEIPWARAGYEMERLARKYRQYVLLSWTPHRWASGTADDEDLHSNILQVVTPVRSGLQRLRSTGVVWRVNVTDDVIGYSDPRFVGRAASDPEEG